jgi:hypothetical protein
MNNNRPIDNIANPPHYNSSDAKCSCGRRLECIDITRHMGFNLGNAIKYLWRWKYKGGVEDLKKAIWYINDEIKMQEALFTAKEPLIKEKE